MAPLCRTHDEAEHKDSIVAARKQTGKRKDWAPTAPRGHTSSHLASFHRPHLLRVPSYSNNTIGSGVQAFFIWVIREPKIQTISDSRCVHRGLPFTRPQTLMPRLSPGSKISVFRVCRAELKQLGAFFHISMKHDHPMFT